MFNSLSPISKRHQSPHYWLFVKGIQRWPVNSPHKGPVARKKLPFDDAIILIFNPIYLITNASIHQPIHQPIHQLIRCRFQISFGSKTSRQRGLHVCIPVLVYINTRGSEQNGRHFKNHIFKWIFLNENYCIFIKKITEVLFPMVLWTTT